MVENLENISAKIFHTKWGIYLAIYILCVIASGITTIRPLHSAEGMPIGAGDAGATASLARNIAEGRGPVVDHVWLLTNGGMPGNEVTRPESYWSVYQAYFISFFFKLFGASLQTYHLIALLLRVLISIVAALIVFKITGVRLAAFCAASFLLLDPSMMKVNNGLFDIYLTTSMFMAMTTFYLAIEKRSALLFAIVGLLVGISISLKLSGLILLPAFIFYLFLKRNRKNLLLGLPLIIIGTIVAMAPLSIYNKTYFDTYNPMPPALNVVGVGNTITYLSGNHDKGNFDPTEYEIPPTLTSYQLVRRSLANLQDFVFGLLRGEILPAWIFPFIFLALYCFMAQVVKEKRMPDGPLAFFCLLSIIMTAGALALSYRVVYQVRYLNFIVPPLTIIAFTSFNKLPRAFYAMAFGLVLFATLAYHGEIFTRKPLSPTFKQASELLPNDAVVFNNNPWEFSFHTGIKTVVLPYTDSLTLIEKVAKRYGVEYLTITDRNVRHPFFRSIQDGKFPVWLEPVTSTTNLVIGKLNWPESGANE